MTRLCTNAQHVYRLLNLKYYGQCTSIPGTLAITEETIICLL